jgi:hypothetical protein
MDAKNVKKDEILFRAEKLLHYNDLLIKQCDSWLTEEEGVKNMEKRIMEREKAKRKTRFCGFFGVKVDHQSNRK